MEQILDLVEVLGRKAAGSISINCILSPHREISFCNNPDGTYLLVDLWKANHYLVDLFLILPDHVEVLSTECSRHGGMSKLRQLDESWAEAMTRMNAHLARPAELSSLQVMLGQMQGCD